MTSALAIRPHVFPAFVLAAVLVLAPHSSRAEGPDGAPFGTLSHRANDGAVPFAPAARPAPTTTGVGRSVRNDEAAPAEIAVVENGWDFTNPDSIPGFGSTPYPVLSNPEIAD